MTVISRRDAERLLVAGSVGLLATCVPVFASQWINSVVRGVQIGAQCYSFRDRPLDAAIKAYQTVGLGECELDQGHVEPNTTREELRKWRITVPLSHFHEIRGKFDNAGVLIYAYNYSFTKDMADEEFERGFQMARALGVKYITSSSPLSIVHKVDGYAQKYKIVAGFHNHDATWDPDQFSNAASFERGLRGTSRWVGVNLDIGHFVAANSDPVSFLRQWHSRVVTLHIKDRKKNHGPNMPFGEGDTPIIAVLRLVRDRHWTFPANIEYEYGEDHPGLDTITEVKKCYAYCRHALET